jgi:hypothetical protein
VDWIGLPQDRGSGVKSLLVGIGGGVDECLTGLFGSHRRRCRGGHDIKDGMAV